MKRLTVIFSLCLLSGLALGRALVPQGFDIPKNQMPFANIAVAHPMDDITHGCPRTGTNDNNVYHQAQNAAKNDFTEAGSPVLMTFDDFVGLQKATDTAISHNAIELQGQYPKHRDQLKNQITAHGKSLGEGTLVTLEAYVYGAHYSNTKYNHYPNGPGTGEANNCKNDALDWNDIHIALISSPVGNQDECGTVTAEISPHYRPATWSKFHDGLNQEIENLLPGLLRHRVVEKQKSGDQLVRIKVTGPLFYDASHQPCTFQGANVVKRNSPARRSIWEIHPIYRIQLYNAQKQKWQELDDWAK